MLRTLIAVAIACGVAAADFTDDFESYTPGDYIESSPNWDREPSGGYAQIVQQSGGNCAEAVFADSSFIGYICSAAGFWADGSVAMDFSPVGVGSFSNVYARLDILNGGSYAAGVTMFLGSFSYAYIAYINDEGDYDLLYSDLGPVITPGTWANVKLHVEGTDPVALTLFIDDEQIIKVYDSVYMLEDGICGFALFYEDQQPTIAMDNFQVIIEEQSFEMNTFGWIKSFFR